MSDKNKTYCLINYGCQMNESDTEHYAGQLQELGYAPNPDFHTADIIIVNTCCVRESAEKKIAGKIGELKAVKRANPDVVICVAGCMAQKDGEKLRKKHPQVDLLLGTAYVNDFKRLLLEFLAERKAAVYTDLTIHQSEFEGHMVRQSSFAAWIPIMYGCNNFCKLKYTFSSALSVTVMRCLPSLSTTWRMMSNGNASEARQLYIPSCIFCKASGYCLASFPGTFKEIEAEMSSGAAFVAPAPVMPTKSITPKNNLFSLIVTSVLLLLEKYHSDMNTYLPEPNSTTSLPSASSTE